MVSSTPRDSDHSVLTLSTNCSRNKERTYLYTRRHAEYFLSEFSAIFLHRHSQHNFYSGLNRKKGRGIVGETQYSYCSGCIMVLGLVGRNVQFLGPQQIMVIKVISDVLHKQKCT